MSKKDDGDRHKSGTTTHTTRVVNDKTFWTDTPRTTVIHETRENGHLTHHSEKVTLHKDK